MCAAARLLCWRRRHGGQAAASRRGAGMVVGARQGDGNQDVVAGERRRLPRRHGRSDGDEDVVYVDSPPSSSTCFSACASPPSAPSFPITIRSVAQDDDGAPALGKGRAEDEQQKTNSSMTMKKAAISSCSRLNSTSSSSWLIGDLYLGARGILERKPPIIFSDHLRTAMKHHWETGHHLKTTRHS